MGGEKFLGASLFIGAGSPAKTGASIATATESVCELLRQPLRKRSPRFQDMSKRLKSVFAMLALTGMSGAPVFCANDQTVTFKMPTVKIPFNVKDQQVKIAASGLMTVLKEERGVNRLKLQLSADFSDLQQNMTAVLSSALDKDDLRCNRLSWPLCKCITKDGVAPKCSGSRRRNG